MLSAVRALITPNAAEWPRGDSIFPHTDGRSALEVDANTTLPGFEFGTLGPRSTLPGFGALGFVNLLDVVRGLTPYMGAQCERSDYAILYSKASDECRSELP